MRDCIGRNLVVQESLLTIQGELSLERTHIQGALKHKDNIAVQFKKRDMALDSPLIRMT